MKIFYESHNIGSKKPYIYHKTGTGFHSHWHENVEILYFRRDGKIICDRNEASVPAGAFAVIGSDVVHTIEWRPEPFYECFIADSAFCLENGMDVSKLDFDVCINDANLTSLYERLTRELKAERMFSEAGSKAAILDLMVYICRNYSRERTAGKARDTSIKKAIIYINSNFGKRMTVDEIASNSALSKYYFCHEFKKVTGYSVIQYINMTKCRTAEKMLATGNFTVSEAAAATGYDNLSYFTRTFKNITGHLPGEYKKSDRN